MATNRPDILDPALVRPGRIDRKIEFTLPDLEGRIQILKIHCRNMNVDRHVRFELVGRLCGPNTTGADLRSVCTEAGMFAIVSVSVISLIVSTKSSRGTRSSAQRPRT